MTSPTAHPTASERDDDYGLFPAGMQKALALSGVAFVLLLIASIMFDPGEWPDRDAAASEWRTFATDSRDDMQLGSLLGLLAVVEYLFFLGVLRSALARAETFLRGFSRMADVAFAGGILAAVGMALGMATTVAVVSLPDDVSGDVIRGLFAISDGTWVPAIVGLAVLLFGAGILIVRGGVFPRWLGWLALVGALCWLLLLFGIPMWEDDDGGVLDFLWPIAMLAHAIVVVGCSVTLFRRVGKPWPWEGLGARR